MIRPRVEYVGFDADDVERSYHLRASLVSGESHEFTIVISNDAFTDHRVRFQDAPEICYLRLQREVVECGDNAPNLHLTITDQDLERYRQGHALVTPRRRASAL